MNVQVHMHATVRGQRVELWWTDGDLSGDAELLDRFNRATLTSPVDTADPAAVLSCLERVLGERPSVDTIAM